MLLGIGDIRADPDLDAFEKEHIDMLRELRKWGSSEMRSTLLASEAAPADPREAFYRLGPLQAKCMETAVLKLNKEWSFEEKYKEVAMDFVRAGLYDTLYKEGNMPGILEAINPSRSTKSFADQAQQ